MLHTTLPAYVSTANRKRLEKEFVRVVQEKEAHRNALASYFKNQGTAFEEGLSDINETMDEAATMNESNSEYSTDHNETDDDSHDLNDNNENTDDLKMKVGQSIKIEDPNLREGTDYHNARELNGSHKRLPSAQSGSARSNDDFNDINENIHDSHEVQLKRKKSRLDDYRKDGSSDSSPVSASVFRKSNSGSNVLSKSEWRNEPTLEESDGLGVPPSSGRRSGKRSGRKSARKQSSNHLKSPRPATQTTKAEKPAQDPQAIQKVEKKMNPQWEFIKTSLVSGYRKLDKILSVDPDSSKKRIWNIIALFVVTFNCIMIPLRIGWGQHQLYWIPVDIILDLVTVIDIILFSMSMYVRDGAKVHEFKRTAKNYVFSRYFVFDIISIIPIEIIGWFVGYYSFFRLNRMIRLIREKYYFETIEELFPNIKPTIIRLLRSILFTLIAAHVIACGFFFIMSIQGESNMSVDFIPARVFYLLRLNFFQQYIRSFYWAIVSMTGYSNTQPQTNMEVAFSLCVSTIGLSLYITIIGTVGSLITHIDASKQYFISRLDEINSFMNFRQLPNEIQDQIREYYTYLWKSRRSLNESKVFADLPIHLQIEVAMKLNEKFIMKVDIFQGAEQQFIERIVLQMRPKLALPGVFVVRQGEIGREMYLISKGEVEVVLGNGLIVATLPAGKIFGEIALLENCRRNASIRAKTYCDLFILSKKDFTEALEAFPEQKARVAELARKKKEETEAKNKN